ncbi:MAG: hypothetical protein RLZZ458_2132, partial [Planctomycetota bacterium]
TDMALSRFLLSVSGMFVVRLWLTDLEVRRTADGRTDFQVRQEP